MCIQNVKSCNMGGLCACFKQTSLLALTIKPLHRQRKWKILQEFSSGPLSVTLYVLLCHINLASEFWCWDFTELGFQQLTEMPLGIPAHFNSIFFFPPTFPWPPCIILSKTSWLKSNQKPGTRWSAKPVPERSMRLSGRHRASRKQRVMAEKRSGAGDKASSEWKQIDGSGVVQSNTTENLKVTLWFISDFQTCITSPVKIWPL